jgi:alpha-beta hydrolase superfamily lysophospholipase
VSLSLLVFVALYCFRYHFNDFRGAIALKVATQLSSTQTKNIKVTGVVLLAPMLAVKVAEPLRYVLWCLAHTIPTLQVIGGSKASSSADQYRDPEKRAECDEDPLAIKGSQLRCASAWSCVELACDLRYHTLDQVTVPFLCLLANQDTVVDNAGSMELMDQSPSTDKTLKKYDALHGLLCEPQPLLGTIHSDILDWINKRCPAI